MHRASSAAFIVAILLTACSRSAEGPPSWIPPYPGGSAQSVAPTRTDQGMQNVITFETKDPAETVLDFYQKKLMDAGIRMEARGGGEYGGILSAKDESGKRRVMIDIRAGTPTSQVTITTVTAR